MQVERQPVGDVDHGVRTRPPGQFALPQAGQRAPVGGHGGAVPAAGPELPQACRRTPARARDQHDVPRPRPGTRDGRRTTVLDRPQHRHGHRQLGRARHVAADHRAPGRRRGLGHAGHDPRAPAPPRRCRPARTGPPVPPTAPRPWRPGRSTRPSAPSSPRRPGCRAPGPRGPPRPRCRPTPAAAPRPEGPARRRRRATRRPRFRFPPCLGYALGPRLPRRDVACDRGLGDPTAHA